MGRQQSCTPELRKIIITMKNNGKTIQEIAKLVGRSRKLVYNAIKFFETHDMTNAIRRNPPPKKTSSADDRIIAAYAKKNPFMTSAEIRDEVHKDHGISLSSRTIRRRLNEKNLIGYVAQHKPLVSKKNISARLTFAREYGQKSLLFWKNVLWSDESKFNRLGSDGKRHVWRPPKQELNPRYTVKTVKHGGGCIMVWAAFSWNGVGPIVKIEQRMDQHQYKSILENHMEPYADDNLPLSWTFMHDNDPKHTSRLVKQWISDQQINILPWPAQSPDLNPIENLWNDVEYQVGLRKPKNLQELWEAIKEGWNSIPIHRCQRLVESIPRRLQAVVRQKGFPTKY